LTLTSRCGKFNQENMYQTLSESASFRKIYDKNILACFSVHNSNCCSLAKRECYVSQGRVETLFRRDGKRLHLCTTNLVRTTCTKFCHSRSGCVNCISKNILVCFFGSQCSLILLGLELLSWTSGLSRF